ncbi:unnamed protein product [Ascophyllum nodosum]
MVSAVRVTSCLALLAPARSFLKPILSRPPGAEIVAATSASSVRQRSTKSSELCMRKTGKFVLSNKAKLNETGPKVVTMNTKTGEIIQEVPRDKPESKAAKAGPGLIKPDMELFCKAGADGISLGDCPFAHYIQMVLHYKELPFKLTPCSPESKPDWLVEEYEGQMPCLVDNGEAYTESSEIVDYIEYFYPEPPLSMKDNPDAMAKAKEVTGGVFGAVAKCIKNLDSSGDPPLLEKVMEELKKVDAYLKDNGPFLCGEHMTLPDCLFAPKLYHASTTLAHFKNTVIPPEMEALHKYMDMIYSHEAFEKSAYPPDVVVWGWNNARGTEAK